MLDGENPEEFGKGLAMNRATDDRWLQQYPYGGRGAVKAMPIPGRPPKLDAGQLAWFLVGTHESGKEQVSPMSWDAHAGAALPVSHSS